MKSLPREQFINTLDPKRKPRLTLASDEEAVVQTWDAFMGTWTARRARHVGLVAGPIAA